MIINPIFYPNRNVIANLSTGFNFVCIKHLILRDLYVKPNLSDEISRFLKEADYESSIPLHRVSLCMHASVCVAERVLTVEDDRHLRGGREPRARVVGKLGRGIKGIYEWRSMEGPLLCGFMGRPAPSCTVKVQ